MTPNSAVRTKRQRHDGTEIDSVKNLAEFLESIPPSGDEPAPKEETAPAVPVAVQIPNEFAGKTPEEIIATVRAERTRAEKAETLARERNEALTQHQTRAQIEEAARRVIAEQRAPVAAQAPPPPDPRLAEIDDKWFTDPPEARRLLSELHDERLKQTLATERETTKKEVFGELTAQQQRDQLARDREQGNKAFTDAMAALRAAGVPETDLNNRFKVMSVYSAITLKPTADAPNAYYTDGGPTNAQVIERAWRDLFSVPTAAQPQVQQPAPAPVIVAPPGSSRPAPAATPPVQHRATPIGADMQRDYAHMAENFGYDAEKLINRRRARLEKEKQ